MSGIHIPVTADYKNFVDGMNAVRNSVKSTMDQVEKSGMSIEDTFNKIRNAAALSFAGFSGAKLIKDIANVRGEFQQLEVAFSTMLGSEEKATDLMNQLVKTAAITPFDLKGVADGAKSLMAYGTAAEDVNETLIRLGDIAAGMSIPLNDLVYLYGTTMVQGRMFTQDLRQFQGRGIPIAEELAKVLKTTKDQIPDLVTAGKVTGEVFQQAIVNMTEAGSKFGGLMEKQSKTIKGQISNIEDAIDVMFNNIGKSSEGIINGALGTVSMLVENYETLGKILVDCAVAYGTYKAAVMVTAAIQSVQTAGIAALTTAEAAHYGWLVLVEKAQKLLNATMLSNPYVLVATALATLVATVVMFNSETESMGELVEKSNTKATKSFEEVEAKIKTEQQAIDELFNKLRKAEKGTNEYKETKDKILGQYGKYLQGLNNEIATLKDVEGAYKAVAAAARDAALARGKEAALSKVNEEYTQNYSDAMSKIYDVLEGKIGKDNADKALDIIKKDLKATGQVAEDTQRTLHKYGVGYSLFGDLNKAEQVLITSTQKINSLFGEQEKQVQETAEKVTTLSEDYAAAEKNYRNAKNWLSQVEKNKADYTAKEYQEAVENLKAQKEAFEKVGGDPEGKKAKSGASAAKEYNNRSAAQIEEELKYQEELAKERQQALDAIEDARISSIRNDGQRERAEQDEQHKRNLRQIEEQANEMKKAVYEHNKTVWENSHKDSPYELTEVGKAGWSNIQLSQNQRSIINAQVEKENADYNRLVLKRYQGEVQAMRDFMKEYGTIQQQKLAIAEEYNQKIAEENDEWRKRSLEKEKESLINNIDIEVLRTDIDWTSMFDGLGIAFSQQINASLERVDKYISSKKFKSLDATQQKSLIDMRNSLYDKAGSRNGLFNFSIYGTIGEDIKALQQAMLRQRLSVEEHTKAQSALITAEKELRSAEEQLKKATNPNDLLTASRRVSVARTAYQGAKSRVDATSREQKEAEQGVIMAQGKLRSSATDAQKSIDNFSNAIKEMTNGTLKGLADGLVNLYNIIVGNGQMDGLAGLGKVFDGEAFAGLDRKADNMAGNIEGAIDGAGKIADVVGKTDKVEKAVSSTLDAVGAGLETSGNVYGMLIGAILQILDALGDMPADFFEELITKILDAVAGIIESIFNGKLVGQIVKAIVQGVMHIIGAIVDTIGSWFGGDVGLTALFSGADYSGLEKAKEKYEALASVWDILIDKKKEYLGESWGVEAEQAAEEALKLLRTKSQYNKVVAQAALDSGASMGSHSIKYRMWEGSYTSEGKDNKGYLNTGALASAVGEINWNDVNLAIERGLSSAGLGTVRFRGMSDMLNMTADQLNWIRENYTGLWANMDDDFRQAIENIIEFGEQEAEIMKQLQEQIVGTSFDSVFDKFMSALNDLASGSEDVFQDVADNWQKMMNQMVLNNLIGHKYKEQLKKWYEQWEKAYTGDNRIDASEINELKEKYNEIVKNAAQEVEYMRQNGLIAAVEGSEGSKDQSTTYSYADKVTYDQMDEFTGILRAVQIAGEQRLDVQREILYTLQTLSGITAPDNSDVREIRSLLGISNDYLLDIRRSNRSILDSFGDKMDTIIKQLNALG